MAGRLGLLVFLISILVSVFGFSITPAELISTGMNLEEVARYILSHASEFEPYTVQIAKVFLGVSASGAVSGAVTGTQAISVWAKVAAATTYGLVVGLAIYDVVKAYQLISALIELSDIKKGIAEVRYFQRYDRIGIKNMPSLGKYQEYFVMLYSKPSLGLAPCKDCVVYEFIFAYPQYFDGLDVYPIEYPGYFFATYFLDGNKSLSSLLGGIGGIHGRPSEEFVEFVTTTGILERAKQIAMSFSYSSPPNNGVWEFQTPGAEKINADPPLLNSDEPLFHENQKIGIVTTPDGKPLYSALSIEQWARVSSITDIAPYLIFQGMEYAAYRTVPSYEVSVAQQMIETSKIYVPNPNPNPDPDPSVDPKTILEIQQQLQTLTQTVQSILSQIQQVQSIPELQQQYQTLQKTQAQLAELVQTLSQTLTQVQTQTKTNTETLQKLQEQYQTAVELMAAVKPALETLAKVQQKYETLQQTQAQLAEQIQTLSQTMTQVQTQTQTNTKTLQQVQTQTQANTKTLEKLQEQYETVSELLSAAQPALEEYPELKRQVQTVLETLDRVQTQIQTLSQSQTQMQSQIQTLSQSQTQMQTQTQEQYQKILSEVHEVNSQIRVLYEILQKISVDVQVDLDPVVQAVNRVAEKVQALSEQVKALEEYMKEEFFSKLFEKMKEFFEEMFIPDPEKLDLKIDLPDYSDYAKFNPSINFSPSSDAIRIELFGASADIGSQIRNLTSPLRPYINTLILGFTSFFVIRAFKVHLVID